MTWNEVLSNIREKIRRGVGRGGQDVQLASPGTRLEPLGDVSLFGPAVDVYESDEEVLIQADVPGGTREGATVAWDEARGLTLLVKSQALPAGTLWKSEFEPGDWYRTIELPEYADGAKATSTIKDGVLTVRIPKRAATSKLIPVKAG